MFLRTFISDEVDCKSHFPFGVPSLSCVLLWDPKNCSTRLLCSSLSPLVSSDSCPLSQWCHPTISSSATAFSCPLSFPASGSFPMSELLHQVTKILELNLQYQSFQWIFRIDFLEDWLVWSPCSPGKGTKTPHASEQLGSRTAAAEARTIWSPCATTRGSTHLKKRSCMKDSVCHN